MVGEERELTFGEKAVGLNFNPSNNQDVQMIKELYAGLINHLNQLRSLPDNTNERNRLLSIAITEAQSAQMWAVKGITYNY